MIKRDPSEQHYDCNVRVEGCVYVHLVTLIQRSSSNVGGRGGHNFEWTVGKQGVGND